MGTHRGTDWGTPVGMEGIAVVVEGIVDTVVDKGKTVAVVEIVVAVGGRDTVGGTVVGVGWGFDIHFGFSVGSRI